MAKIQFGLKLTSDALKILRTQVLRGFTDEFNRRMPLLIPALEGRLRKYLIDKIQATAEYNSLLDGKLRAEFGIPDADVEQVSRIPVAVADGMVITFIRATSTPAGRIRGGLTIRILRRDQKEVLGLPIGSYVSPRSGEKIDWLKWLLTAGDSIIISQWRFTSSIRRQSRTRSGIMIPEKKRNWQVPPEYAGTLQTNWLVRTLVNQSVRTELDGIISQELLKVFV